MSFNNDQLNNLISRLTNSIDNVCKRTNVGEVYPVGEVYNVSGVQEQVDDALRNRMNYQSYGLARNNNLYDFNSRCYIRDAKMDSEFQPFQKAKEFESIYPEKLIQYIAAILDPELNYSLGLQVKQPSLLSTPSVSIPIKTLTTIPSENFNSICISWNPITFCTVKDLAKIQVGTYKSSSSAQPQDLYANRICSVLYSVGQVEEGVTVPPSSWGAIVHGIPDNLPDVGIAKARLVSSKIKISFRGSIMHQGGTIMGCATFQGAPGVIAGNVPVSDTTLYNSSGEPITWSKLFSISNPTLNPDQDRSPFEEKIVSNGIWAHNVNITADANGISAVFIPTDPMDEIFYTPGTYYGESIRSDVLCTNMANTLALTSNKGAHLNYLFNIQGLPNTNNDPIIIETYTTWEVIPTNESASTLRNYNSQSLTNEESAKARLLIDEYFTKTDGVHTVGKYNTGNVFTDFIKGLAKNVYEKYLK